MLYQFYRDPSSTYIFGQYSFILLCKMFPKHESPTGSARVKQFSHLMSIKRDMPELRMYANYLLRVQEVNWAAVGSEMSLVCLSCSLQSRKRQ